MSDIQGYWSAIRYLEDHHPGGLSGHTIQQTLDDVIHRMRINDPPVISVNTLGFLVERDGEGELRVWVDPELAR